MALRSGLTIWCYTAPTATSTQPLVAVPYQQNLVGLRFTTQNPGGYGEFSFDVYVGDARIPRPELNMFSRCVIMDGLTCLFVGEITDPPYGLEPGREYVRVRGLGLGNCLRDDAIVRTYSNKKAQQIAKDLLEYWTNGSPYRILPLDTDESQLFPDNPSPTISPGYDIKNFEEMLSDVCIKSGNVSGGVTTLYTWWTQAHAVNRDAAGFPTLQLYAVKEDFTTVSYQASLLAHEVVGYSVEPSAERSANEVVIGYNNGAGGVGYAAALDSRLDATSLAQNTAPFRFKKIVRDLSADTTVTSALAAQIAQWLLAEYKNGSNKVQIVLRGVRDASGNPVELWSVNALNTNIAVPEAAVRGATLPTTYTAGVNLHHIKRATYSETTDYAELTIDADNFADGAASMIARLELAADTIARSVKTGAGLQGNGQPIVGGCGFGGISTSAGGTYSTWVSFPQQAAAAPTGVTLTQTSNTNVTGTPSVSGITALGFTLNVVSTGTGTFLWTGTYTTTGN